MLNSQLIRQATTIAQLMAKINDLENVIETKVVQESIKPPDKKLTVHPFNIPSTKGNKKDDVMCECGSVLKRSSLARHRKESDIHPANLRQRTSDHFRSVASCTS